MKPKDSAKQSACVLQLKKGGTYELTYTVSIPPMCELEANFFLRCNEAILEQTIRHIRKKSGYRLTVLERTRCELADHVRLAVDAQPQGCLHGLSPCACCSICAKRLL
ncbi:MAG: hypothetical protein PHE47_00360 [Oscillospiraceae bacterium]|nr:hypothetical protein [Oscillospiraceae bacterium]